MDRVERQNLAVMIGGGRHDDDDVCMYVQVPQIFVHSKLPGQVLRGLAPIACTAAPVTSLLRHAFKCQ